MPSSASSKACESPGSTRVPLSEDTDSNFFYFAEGNPDKGLTRMVGQPYRLAHSFQVSARPIVPLLPINKPSASFADGLIFWVGQNVKVFTYGTWFYPPLGIDEFERIQGSKCAKCGVLLPVEGMLAGVGLFSQLNSLQITSHVSELLGFRKKQDPKRPQRRLCHFTGLYFCSDCHRMDRRVVPSHVMHYGRTEPLPVRNDEQGHPGV